MTTRPPGQRTPVLGVFPPPRALSHATERNSPASLCLRLLIPPIDLNHAPTHHCCPDLPMSLVMSTLPYQQPHHE